MNVPTPMAIGAGVTTAKRSSGGVIASRLSGSAKKAKTASSVGVEGLLAAQRVDGHHHGLRMSFPAAHYPRCALLAAPRAAARSAVTSRSAEAGSRPSWCTSSISARVRRRPIERSCSRRARCACIARRSWAPSVAGPIDGDRFEQCPGAVVHGAQRRRHGAGGNDDSGDKHRGREPRRAGPPRRRVPTAARRSGPSAAMQALWRGPERGLGRRRSRSSARLAPAGGGTAGGAGRGAAARAPGTGRRARGPVRASAAVPRRHEPAHGRGPRAPGAAAPAIRRAWRLESARARGPLSTPVRVETPVRSSLR